MRPLFSAESASLLWPDPAHQKDIAKLLRFESSQPPPPLPKSDDDDEDEKKDDEKPAELTQVRPLASFLSPHSPLSPLMCLPLSFNHMPIRAVLLWSDPKVVFRRV